jgi:hypothetical protein
MKIEINCDERYPDYYFHEVKDGTSNGITVDISSLIVAKWRVVESEYSKMQTQLRELRVEAIKKKQKEIK